MALVMVATVVLPVATGNLAMVLFARRVAHVITADRILAEDGGVRYAVRGPLFFGSSNDLVERFWYARAPARVVVDLTEAQIWDASTVAAMDSIETKFAQHGTKVTFVALDERSTRFHQRLSGRLDG